ncbi:MAG: hypothetical protein R3275_08455, partial [Saprospiraceae bacterium]|nr:hypothetical protein [Saprospiraceae bacterium]
MYRILLIIAIFQLAHTGWSQCNQEVSGIFYYCRPENPDSFFVAFRIHGDPDTFNIVDLNGNAPMNSGLSVDDIESEEEPRVMGQIDSAVSYDPITLTLSDTIEYRYFGPMVNGASFNLVVVDTDGVCDTIHILEDTYDCSGKMSGGCDSEVPFYEVDLTANPDDSFEIIQRSRVESCCDAGNSAYCFEFRVTLADVHVGLIFEDIGSGASGGELLADYASGFSCTGNKAMTWPFIQESGASAPTLCLSGGETYFVASCKPGGNTTGVKISGIIGPRTPDLATPETCDFEIDVQNAEQVSWRSDEDPNLFNLSCHSIDSLDCTFSYDSVTFGQVFNCAGDTFYYIATVMPEDIECVGDTMFSDTSMVVVYPVFTLSIDTICHDHPDSVSLKANINGPANACPYDYIWSNGDTTQMITVLADNTDYTVTVNRSDIDLNEDCIPNSISATAVKSSIVECTLGDSLLDCEKNIPDPDVSLIEVTSCGDNHMIFAVDRKTDNSGCSGDTAIVERTYYIDFDGDLMTLDDLDSCIQIFRLTDSVKPEIICPSDTVINCSEDTSPSNLGNATATDNCTENVTDIDYTDNITGGSCGNNFTIERTWTATDSCGNSSTCLQTIQVQDTTKPQITCPPDMTVDCSEQITPPNLGYATASDDCTDNVTDISFSDNITGGSCGDNFTIERTWTVTDSCGNSATCLQIIKVQDLTAPIILCPSDTIMGCGDDTSPGNTGYASATDDCSKAVTDISHSDKITPGSCNNDHTIERTWTATDSCGNSNSCVQMIMVQDTTGPSLVLPPDTSLNCDQDYFDLNISGFAVAQDICDDSISLFWSDDLSGLTGCGRTGQILRTFTASDDCGNITSGAQTLTIVDSVDLTVDTLPGLVFDCDVDRDTVSFTGNIEVSSCHDLDTTYSDDLSEFRCGGTGLIKRTWTISDTCGREVMVAQDIQMTDESCMACLDTIVMLPGDTCFSEEIFEFEEVKRFEFCGDDHYEIVQSNSGPCISVSRISAQNVAVPNLDTTCVLMCDTMNGVEYCDTTYVIIIQIPQKDTLIKLKTDELADTICLEEFLEWGLAYEQSNVLDPFTNLSYSIKDVNSDSCMVINNNNHTASIDSLMLENCYDTLGYQFCDTTNFIIITTPPSDTMVGRLNAFDTTIFCFDTVLQFESTYTSMIMCGEPKHVGSGRLPRSNQDTCIQMMSSDDYAGLDTMCLLHCYSTPLEPIYDTTVIIVIVQPARDTIYRAPGENFCLESPIYELPEVELTSVCDSGDRVSLTVLNDSCFRLDPIGALIDPDTVCIVMCDTINGIELCDTTLVITQECPNVLACNDLVHLSLDDNCRATLTGDLLVEGSDLYSDFVDLYIEDKNGDPHINLFDGSDVGERFTVRAVLENCGVTCWGEIMIEDKHIPELLCPDTVTVLMCDENTDPESIGLPLPDDVIWRRVNGKDEFVVTGFDPCGDVWLSYYDERVKNTCTDSFYYFITRYWTVRDESGNETSCTEEIGILVGTLDSLVFPPDYNDFERFALECDDAGFVVKSQPVGGVNIGWNPLPNGHPSPFDLPLFDEDTLIGTGYPAGVMCDNIGVKYTDRRIETCGETYKLIRTWRVYDWCTGEDTVHMQVIKVRDTRTPVIICPSTDPVRVPTDPWTCTGTYIVPDPIFDPDFSGTPTVPVILKECNDWSYEIRHKVANEGSLDPDECDQVDESETFFTNNVRQLPDGRWEVFDMPQGCNWIKYIITDACGNSVECGIELFVEDDQPPIGICDEHTVVSLNSFGEAQLCAMSLDDGSEDNCTMREDLRYQVKRMNEHDSLFRDCLELYCEDVIQSPFMVVMRVIDLSENHNDCMVEVVVQDKSPTVIECPDDITLYCDQDYTNDSLTGIPFVFDQCNDSRLVSEIVVRDVNDCGLGFVIKKWSAVEDGVVSDTCTQRIDLIDSSLFAEANIIWPEDYTVNGCELIDAHPDNLPLQASYPRYSNTDCAKPAAGYEDKVFYNASGYCVKIFRTWEVVDWCQYDVNSQSGGLWTFEQTILVDNTSPPVIAGQTCEPLRICAYDDCLGDIDITGIAVDDCTPVEDLLWRFEFIDVETDSVLESGSGNVFQRSYEEGNYELLFSVRDACGNVSSCTKSIVIEDCKRPTP